MNIVNGITSEPTQVMAIPLADGSRATLTLYFRPQQNGWFYDLEWPGSGDVITPFKCQNRRLVVAGNLLRQFKELIPFGLAVFTVDNTDPVTQACMSDGSTSVVLLNAADVERIESEVYAS